MLRIHRTIISRYPLRLSSLGPCSLSSLAGSGFQHINPIQFQYLSPSSDSTPFIFSYGNLGHLARSSILCRYGTSSDEMNDSHPYIGDTVVHAVVCTAPPSEKFLQVLVDYKYRQYAMGVIPSALNRRDRTADEDILISRVIDRSIRPLFPKGPLQDIQVRLLINSLLCLFRI